MYKYKFRVDYRNFITNEESYTFFQSESPLTGKEIFNMAIQEVSRLSPTFEIIEIVSPSAIIYRSIDDARVY